MAIRRIRHARLWHAFFTEITQVQAPVLTFGVQYIDLPRYAFSGTPLAAVRRLITTGDWHPLPADYAACRDVAELLHGRGIDKTASLDLFDSQAMLHHDMNERIPEFHHAQYRTLIDIGSLKHVFDTRQCLENCIRMLTVGGWYLLHVPVNGYFAHGLHVLNPHAVINALRLNGFVVRYKIYTTAQGRVIKRPGGNRDQLLWLAAEKIADLDRFTPPQQDYWEEFYQTDDRPTQREIQRRYWSSVT
jgi:hypothetical protein